MDATRIQERLASLLAETRVTELDRYDDEEGSTILQRVVPEFAGLVQRGRDLLHQIEDACSAAGASSQSWVSPDRSDRLAELENLCFFVEGEWKRSLQAIEGLTETTSGWNCLVQIERARDRLIRGLVAVERELAAVAGSASRTAHVDLVRDALRVRRVLTEFRREIADASSSRSSSHALDGRLRRSAEALGDLVERREFARLRAADRHLALELHRRVHEWLESGSERQDPDEGEGLWQDVVNFAVLLWDVNRRDELVDRDLAAIDEADGELESQPRGAPVPPSVRAELGVLYGRDDRLDDLLEEEAESDRIRERLLAVRESLVRERVPQPW